MKKNTQNFRKTHLKIFQLFGCHRQLRTIHHRLIYKWYLWNYRLNLRPFMFFPANFWPHKNHRMLLTAYGMFIARNPKEKLDLVLAGTIEKYEKQLKEGVKKMGLAKRVHFIGLEGQNKLAAVLEGSSFLIFPSLYETSFLPLLEAIAFNKPIVCSDIPNLSEIAQDAALYFDPRKPENILQCLEQITKAPSLRSDLIHRGQQRIEDLGLNKPTIKNRGLSRFQTGRTQNFENLITGIYDDKWTYPEIIVAFKAGPRKRLVEFHLEAPSHIPSSNLKLYLRTADGPIQEHRLERGDDIVIRQKLPKGPGYLTVWISPVFRPSEMMNGSSDRRLLGCLCHGCWLISPQQERITLFRNTDHLDKKNSTALLA